MQFEAFGRPAVVEKADQPLPQAAEVPPLRLPAVPPETVVHFNIPATVGELIPNLDEDARREVVRLMGLMDGTTDPDPALDQFERTVKARNA